MAREVRVGLAGLGIAARQELQGFQEVEAARLVAVADIRTDELDRFKQLFAVETFTSVEDMCRDPDIDAVWICTPNHLHAEHTIIAAEHGKHVICEKPMAVTMEEANRMVEAVERNGVKYVQGHSKIYRLCHKKMGEVVSSGRLGRVIQINHWMYGGWLRRPLMASEVEENRGGGIVYRQGPHQMDIVRYLGGGIVRSLRATAGRWNPHFDIEGNYSAFLDFEDGPTGLVSFNGYGHFQVAELTWGIGEGGPRSEHQLFGPRAKATRPLTADEKYALPDYSIDALQRQIDRRPTQQDFYGLTIVSCERGDIRQYPDGLYIYTDDGREELPVGPNDVWAGELEELVDGVLTGRPVFPDVYWGRATLEACLAVLQSSRERREVYLHHQVPSPVRPATPAA